MLRVRDQDGGRVGDLACSGDVAAPDVSTPVPLGRLYVGIHVPATGPGPEPRFLVRGCAALRLDSTEVITGPSGDVLRLTGVKVPSIIAPANASAVLATAADPASVTPPLPGTEPLLAPVLAR